MLNTTFGYELDATVVNADRQRRCQAFIASGGNRTLVEATLDALNLRTLFDTIVTVEDVAQGKPAFDIFLLAARRLGVGERNCIVYEDSDGGLEAAPERPYACD